VSNPLLSLEGLPPFSEIRPEHVEPAIDALIQHNRQGIEDLLAGGGPFTWDTLIEPLEIMEDRLSRAWSPVRHMNAVVNSDALRDAYNACLPKLSDYATELGQNRTLYEAYRSLRDSVAFESLDTGQRKTIDDALRDFHLSGVDLPPERQQRFKAIQQELTRLQSKFEENLLDATHAWTRHFTDSTRLSGLPESALDLGRQNAAQQGKDGWVFNLEFPSYQAIMTYADDRELRRDFYHGYTTRASDQAAHPEWDNSKILCAVLRLRREAAGLLGYPSYAHKSLATKMADTPEQVLEFLHDLAQRSRPAAVRDYDELKAFARAELGLDRLEAWDVGYAGEKLRQSRFAISQEDLKPYFPVDRVLSGLFALVQRLYGVVIERDDHADVWHPDVRFYEIRDEQGRLRAQFYLDLYARPKKRGGAWMDECVNRLRTQDWVQLPVAYMTCNSSPPLGDKPALFTHDEVLTLFHEFGHGLHHMLTRVDYPSVAGINGVEWDAVELPSQFMENWCWEREALNLFAGHYETGEPLPEDLYQRLLSTKHFQAGMQMVRQLEFALFDMRIHLELESPSAGDVQRLLDEVRAEVAVVEPPDFNRFQHGFSHIFAGGYGAGYYSYKWAEVLSADAFARFEEEGLFSSQVGHDFLHQVLECGGTRPAIDSFTAFRGREPSIDALLRHSGLAA
jgi:oligopeptidase A